MMNLIIDIIQVMNFMLLLGIKGLNLNLFSHVAIGKTLLQAYMKLYSDINKKMQFNRFMNNLEKDFPLIKFVVGQDGQEESEDSFVQVVPHLEDCAICQDQMATARKLSCGHSFHQFCII